MIKIQRYHHAYSTRAVIVQHYDGVAIVTVCYLAEVCITVYHITSMIEIQMYDHAYMLLA